MSRIRMPVAKAMELKLHVGEKKTFSLPRCESGWTWDTYLSAADFRVINLSVLLYTEKEISVFGKTPGMVVLFERDEAGEPGRKIVITVRETPRGGKQHANAGVANDEVSENLTMVA